MDVASLLRGIEKDLWYGFEDLVYLLLKVHVQESVSFIKHQMLQQF